MRKYNRLHHIQQHDKRLQQTAVATAEPGVGQKKEI